MVKKYFEAARAVSLSSDFHSQKVGCAVVYKKAIIAAAHNSIKTSPHQAYYNKFRDFDDCRDGKYKPQCVHSEISALMKIRFLDIDWSKVELYIWRERKDTPHGGGMARPCPACMALIRSLKIKKIYYSSNDGLAEEKIIY